MTGSGGPPFSEQILKAVVVVLAVAVAARAAWVLLAPMVGGLIVFAALIVIYRVLLRRFRGW